MTGHRRKPDNLGAKSKRLLNGDGVQTTHLVVKRDSTEDADRTISISLRGTFLSVRAALRSMLRAGTGSIVITGSTSSVVAPGSGGSPDYRASKHGVLGLARAVAVEYGRRTIRANCACPGSFPATRLVENTLMLHRGDTELGGTQMREIGAPMGRSGAMDEFASDIAFPASPDSSYNTGQAILVNGGYTATGAAGLGTPSFRLGA
jgi:NAD(P)-dependent dehydrogenase (short-subunit alcohol dehydrogenase family)